MRRKLKSKGSPLWIYHELRGQALVAFFARFFVLLSLLSRVAGCRGLFRADGFGGFLVPQWRFSLFLLLFLGFRVVFLLDLCLFVEFLMFQEGLIAQQIFLPVLFAVKLPLLYPFSQAAVMDEVPAVQSPQKGFLLIRANNAF